MTTISPEKVDKVATEKEPAQELVELAELPDGDPRKLEAFLQVRTILVQLRPELEQVFHGLFEKGRHARDARTFLGRVREAVSGKVLSKDEFHVLMEASAVPGFGLIRVLLEDLMFSEEKLPVMGRVIREVTGESPTVMGGKAPACCPNIGG